MRDDVKVLHVLDLLLERGEFVEMRCEEAECVDLGSDIPWNGCLLVERVAVKQWNYLLGDRPSKAESVVCRGTFVNVKTPFIMNNNRLTST